MVEFFYNGVKNTKMKDFSDSRYETRNPQINKNLNKSQMLLLFLITYSPRNGKWIELSR